MPDFILRVFPVIVIITKTGGTSLYFVSPVFALFYVSV